jgi:hypothetical protein
MLEIVVMDWEGGESCNTCCTSLFSYFLFGEVIYLSVWCPVCLCDSLTWLDKQGKLLLLPFLLFVYLFILNLYIWCDQKKMLQRCTCLLCPVGQSINLETAKWIFMKFDIMQFC